MNKKKLLSLLLALALTVSCLVVLASCGPTQDSSSKESTSGTIDPDPDLDFKGKVMKVSQSINVWDSASSIPNAEKYTRGPSDIGSDDVLNLCYARNKEVANALNVKIEYQETNYRYNEINPYLDQIAVMATAPVDLVINDVYAVKPAMLKGQLYNLKSTAEENHFNFEHESWYQDFINGLTYDPSRVYAMAGDYFMDVIRTTHCLYVNTEIFEIQLKDYYEEMKEFYTMIKDGGWTYDEMQTLITAGWKSTSGSSMATPDDEYVGLWCTASWGFTLGSGLSMVEKTADGQYVFTEDTSTLSSYAKKLCDLWNADGVYYDSSNDASVIRQKFTEGSVLFLTGFWMGDLEYSSFYAMEKKSPIVYPKWDESVPKYSTWIHDSAEIGYILTNTANFTPMSAYCQLINEKSVEVMQSYYEYALKFGKNTDAEAVEMLDVIRNSIISPFEQYLTGGGHMMKIMNTTSILVANNPAAAATDYLSNKPDYQKQLSADLLAFQGLED